MAITYSEDGKKKVRKGNKKAIALNDGPSTPIKLYTDVNQPHGRFLPDSGAGRIKNIRLKKKKV
tara:strand:+ start:924 stop:1115 length:192 start_codon:yes stop_codon:yes gene_type:complete